MKQSSETLTSLSSINEAFIKPFPNSTKVYVKGSRDDIRVPMRQIKLTDTIGDLAEKNDPVHVYDTSGPYTDPSKTISVMTPRFLMVLARNLQTRDLAIKNLMSFDLNI